MGRNKGSYWKTKIKNNALPTINDKINCQTAENGVVLDTTSNLKLILETIWSG